MRDLDNLNWRIAPMAVFDCETTGVNPFKDRVVQFAGLVVKQHMGEVEILDSINLLINPQMEIPEGASNVHGITNEDVDDKPIFCEVLPEIKEFFSQAVCYAGYNIHGFDLPLVQNEYNRCGEHLDSKFWLDAILWYREYKGRFSRTTLNDAAKSFGAHRVSRVMYGDGKLHDAMVDIEVTADVIKKMGERKISSWTLLDMQEDQAKILERQLEYLDNKYGRQVRFTFVPGETDPGDEHEVELAFTEGGKKYWK